MASEHWQKMLRGSEDQSKEMHRGKVILALLTSCCVNLKGSELEATLQHWLFSPLPKCMQVSGFHILDIYWEIKKLLSQNIRYFSDCQKDMLDDKLYNLSHHFPSTNC